MEMVLILIVLMQHPYKKQCVNISISQVVLLTQSSAASQVRSRYFTKKVATTKGRVTDQRTQSKIGFNVKRCKVLRRVILATHYRVYPFPKYNSNKLHGLVKGLTDLIDCSAATVLIFTLRPFFFLSQQLLPLNRHRQLTVISELVLAGPWTCV